MCAGGRHGTGAEWVLDGKSVRVSWSFLVPVMADESEQRVQIFFQKKSFTQPTLQLLKKMEEEEHVEEREDKEAEDGSEDGCGPLLGALVID